MSYLVYYGKIMANLHHFIDRAQKVHGDLYDYSESIYHNRTEKVKIVCKICGPFWQRPDSHWRGAHCPTCAKRKAIAKQKDTRDIFIDKAKLVHGNNFDYSKVDYQHSGTKVLVICKSCLNEILVRPSHHLNGSKCPHCVRIALGRLYLLSRTEFIQKAAAVHNNKYDYTQITYRGCANNIDIKCRECHSIFTQLANNHLAGSGCPECAKRKADLAKTKSTEMVIAECKQRVGDRFDYSKVYYKNCATKIIITCKRCNNDYHVFVHNHKKTGACPYCGVSSGHRQIIDYIQSITNHKIIINDRKTISPYELDIYIPDRKLAIEFHGLYRHSYSEIPPPNIRCRHQTKALLCEKSNIRLLQFWSHEWDQKQIIVKSMIKHQLQQSIKIYARACKIIKISDNFFTINHIQGLRHSAIAYGLIYNDIIVAGMSFCKHHQKWEIIRYANLLNHTVVGGSSKLLNHFIKTHQPNELLSFADLRFSVGNVYQLFGFKQLKITKPNYFYTDKRATKLLSRQSHQKHKLSKKLENFDPTKSEIENCLINGLRILYDAGHTKWLWKQSIIKDSSSLSSVLPLRQLPYIDRKRPSQS